MDKNIGNQYEIKSVPIGILHLKICSVSARIFMIKC